MKIYGTWIDYDKRFTTHALTSKKKIGAQSWQIGYYKAEIHSQQQTTKPCINGSIN
jgi:hypothetical protein